MDLLKEKPTKKPHVDDREICITVESEICFSVLFAGGVNVTNYV